jgi:hypothetical protein
MVSTRVEGWETPCENTWTALIASGVLHRNAWDVVSQSCARCKSIRRFRQQLATIDLIVGHGFLTKRLSDSTLVHIDLSTRYYSQ